MRCDIVAEGIIAAVKNLQLEIPLVVRLQGTKVDEAKKIIKESGLRMIAIDDMDLAAKKAVAMCEVTEAARKHQLKIKFDI